MDLKPLATKVAGMAPILGTALGGPVGGVIGNLIATTFGANPNDAQDILTKIQNDPQAALKLQELQNTHKEFLLSHNEKMAQLDYTDVQSARSRQVELAKAGQLDRTPEHFLILTLVAIILVYVSSAFIDENPAQAKITNTVLNLLSLVLGQGLGYLYGGRRMQDKIASSVSLPPPFVK